MALICQIALPLLPLGIELYFTKKVSDSGLSMAAAMFTLGVGVTSAYLILFIFSVIAGLWFSACYGFVLAGSTKLEYLSQSAVLTIALFALAFALERFARHVVKNEKYANFD